MVDTKEKKIAKTATKKTTPSKFAVILTGGKQYKVSEGQIITIEKMKPSAEKKEYKEGDKIDFDKVLLVENGKDTKVGNPYLKTKVSAEIVSIGRDKKITVVHFKSKSRHFLQKGHRQPHFKVKIVKI